MVAPEDDFPHPVPPQAFMTLEGELGLPRRRHREAGRVTVPLLARPGEGEGIFTAKFCIDDWEHRYVGRSPVPARPDGVRAGREREDHLRGRDAGRAVPHHLRPRTSSTPTSGTRAASTRGTSTTARSRPATRSSASAVATSSTSTTTSRPSSTRARSRSRPGRARARRSRSPATATATTRGAGARTSPSGITTGSARRSRPLRREHRHERDVLPGRRQVRRLDLDGRGQRRRRVGRHLRRLLARGGPAAALPRPRRPLPGHDRGGRERDA